MTRKMITVDGATACAHVVHAVNEMIIIYPITPSTPIAEICDAKSAKGEKNIWGWVPRVLQMQSEAGVGGAIHGALTSGALASTASASQGLLLLIPDMNKIAGELTPAVFHIAARSLAYQALSIFGDHSDVMAARQTGWAMLCAKDVQEAQDMALIAHAATLEARVPFMHFFDGFRTSHEIQKIEELSFDDMRAMIDEDLVLAHRLRGLTPDRPSLRGTTQNPDVYFQGRETANPYYARTPALVQRKMDKFAALTGRQYRLFEYFGHPEAEQVIVIMGSAGDTVRTTIEALNRQKERLGVLLVRLYRPFDTTAFANAIPRSVKAIAVLDRTKEPGAIGEPLYLDVRTAIGEAMETHTSGFKTWPRVIGGRYGLSSKDFTPAMVKGVFDNLRQAEPKNHFTVGINDDVSHTSIAYDPSFKIDTGKKFYRALFYGLGADGTVGANKNTIKIIGTETDNFSQGYFEYDSHKSGAVTISHLRFGKDEIRTPYLLEEADFIACHNPAFVEKFNMLARAKQGAIFLYATSYRKDEVWNSLPVEFQEQLIAKKMKFFIIDAFTLAEEIGLGARINTIMQTAFFVISGIIPGEQAIGHIKAEIKKTYGKKGDIIVQMNYASVDRALQSIQEVPVPATVTSTVRMRRAVPDDAPDFVKTVIGPIIEGRGDTLPVSAIPADGTWPTGTTRFEKRNIGYHIPIWEPQICIQCGLCSFVCPHATIRMKAYPPGHLSDAPAGFKSVEATGKDLTGLKFTVQVAPEDCTGCGSCVHVCPAHGKDEKGNKLQDVKAINMRLQEQHREKEAECYAFFLALPETDPARYNTTTVKGSQFRQPLFEYHSSCAGCGETPYIRLLTQLFGDRLYVANATGCSSIYGGNLPTHAYTTREDGRGPTWSNSLFEDNAEFGFGMRQAVEVFYSQAVELLNELMQSAAYRDERQLFEEVLKADQSAQPGIEEQRGRVQKLKERLKKDGSSEAKQLLSLADYLVRKSVWCIGGDGWAYDIGYGGLDHVLASGQNINILVLDTEVYSNTGGQMSKATPLAAQAEFAAAGKRTPKKNLGMIMSTYGNAYIAQIAFGANPVQTIKAFQEAEAYPGPSLVVAYATCIAQGIDMSKGVDEMKRAVACGHWPLYRYNPGLETLGKNPLVIDSGEPTITFAEYAYNETRYRALRQADPGLAAKLMELAEADVKRRWKYLKHIAAWTPGDKQKKEKAA